ncbi:hypothetical protein GCM10025866_13540 [Naasia aerilata]|uniref:Dehydrogenase n=1 Tax=Naasia aerilata TaxID=1162966 RepID=A0ABN6XKH0_9MICO|nr:hypothetical protein GCM10025866_13540 [Naasia aerilata]
MPQGKPLRVAMIGHAFMGRAHSQAWRNVGAFFDVPAVELGVLVGREAERSAAAADQLGWAESSTDWRSIVAREDIDIVDVCTPGASHAEMAIAALEAGKHVVVEKPLANSVEDAERLTELSASLPEQAAIVNFNYRRVPALALAKRVVDDGRLGAIRQIRGAYLQDWLSDPEAPMTWRLRKEEAGSGVLGDLGSHVTDLIRHLTGESITTVAGGLQTFVPERPSGGGREKVTVDDAAWATLGLSGGGVARFDVSRVALGRRNGLNLEIYGERGALRFDLERLNELEFYDGNDPDDLQGFRSILVTEASQPYAGNWWPSGHILGWEHTFTHQFAEFLTAIREGRQANPSFADGLAVQRVLDAVERSAAEDGRTLPSRPDPAGTFRPGWCAAPYIPGRNVPSFRSYRVPRTSARASTAWSISSRSITRGGAKRSVEPWVSFTRMPRSSSARQTARPVASDGSMSTPAHRPAPRTATTPVPISSRSRPCRCAPSAAARAWNSPVPSIRTTSRPTAAASGFPPKVEPCSPGRRTPRTSPRPTTADTGTIPPPSALPSRYRSGTTPTSSHAKVVPVRPRPDWISSATKSTFRSSQSARTAGR